MVEASPHEVSLTRLDSKAYYEEQGDAGALHGVSVGSNLTHPERLSDMEMGCEDHVKSPKRKRYTFCAISIYLSIVPFLFITSDFFNWIVLERER